MKWILLLIPLLLVAGCVEQGTVPATLDQTGGQQQEVPQVAAATPEDAAREYTVLTYFDGENTKYSDFTYNTETVTPDTAKVTIRYKVVTATPSYSVTQIREQNIVTEKRGDKWIATSTPNAKVISQSYG